MRLHHIGIVVKDISEMMDLYGRLLGLVTEHDVFHDKNQKVKVLFVPVGDVKLEFIEPAGEDTPVSKFLEKRGGGIHHIAFEVDDIDGETEKIREKGVKVVCEPTTGFEQRHVSFFHPKSFNNVLVEFVEKRQ